MRATFVDSGVIIAAGSGTSEEFDAAWAILTDSNRELWTSPFVEMEVAPHAERRGMLRELTVYREFFKSARVYNDLEEIVKVAAGELRKTNLGLADALHLAAAHLAGVDEFVTTENINKPMYRNTLVKVVNFK